MFQLLLIVFIDKEENTYIRYIDIPSKDNEHMHLTTIRSSTDHQLNKKKKKN